MNNASLLKSLITLALLPFAVAAQEQISYTYFDMAYVDNGLDRIETAVRDTDSVAVKLGEGDGIGLRASLALDKNFHVFAGYTRSNLDLNATQTIGLPSLDAMRAAFMATPDAEHWDAPCDLTGDGIVNYGDLARLKELMANGEIDRIASAASTDGDLEDWRIGIGYNRLLAPRLSGYAQLFWHGRDMEFDRMAFMGADADYGATDSGLAGTLGLRGQLTDRVELTGRITYTPVGDIDMLAASGAERLRDDTLFGLGARIWFTDTFSMIAEVEGDGDTQAWMLAASYRTGS